MKKPLSLVASLFLMLGCTPSNASPTPPKPAPHKPNTKRKHTANRGVGTPNL